jgi:small-conductance mechanosensitive channel
VEQLLADVVKRAVGEVPGMLDDPEPAVAFEPGFGESGMAFTLTFHVTEFAKQGPVRNELRRRVLRRFRADGIGIPYPSRTVYMRGSGGKPGESGEAREVPGSKDI